jgi:hypothetical protein
MLNSRVTQLAPERNPIAMTIFLVLNGMGLVFLLYVLASFWREGYRTASNVHKRATQFRSYEGAHVFVVTRPISRSARRIDSVVPFKARERFADTQAQRMATNARPGISARQFPTG